MNWKYTMKKLARTTGLALFAIAVFAGVGVGRASALTVDMYHSPLDNGVGGAPVTVNTDTLKALEVDGGGGCVAPSAETAQDGTYTPLSRPLFIYPSKQALAKPEVKAFFDYYVANDATIATDALFIPLNEEQKAKLQSDYAALTGS